jgi:flagellar FliL protein
MEGLVMAEEPVEKVSEETSEAPKKKRGRKLIPLALMGLILLGAGGGGFYYWKARAAAKARASSEASGETQNGKKDAAKEEDGEVKQVIELQPFIVNLLDKGENRYLRMTISLGLAESGEAKADPLFTTKVRNAVLAVLTTKTSDQVLTVEGKTLLREEMLKAARKAVDKPEVHAIYITDFIVQM